MSSLPGVKLTVNAGIMGLISGSGRSSGVESGNPLQYSCLKNSKDRRAQRVTVHGARQLDTTECLSTCGLHTQFRHSGLLLAFRESFLLVWEPFSIQVHGRLPSASLASSSSQGKLSQAYCVPLLPQRVCLHCSREAFWGKDSSSEEPA